MYRNLLNLLLLAFIIPSSSATGECIIGNKTVHQNDKIMGACAYLVCNNGTFCEPKIEPPHPCCYTCIVRDDPHVFTLDGCKYEAMTECVVTLIQTGKSYNPALALFVKFEKCSRFQDKTCLSTMVFKPFPNYYIKFDPATWKDKFVTIGSRKGVNSPYVIKNMTFYDTHTTDVGKKAPKNIFVWFNHDCFHMLTYRGMWFIYCHTHHGLHTLTLHTPHRYAPETHGLCNKYLPKGKQFSRKDTVSYCNNRTDEFNKEFIEGWEAVNNTCHLPAKRKVNLRTKNFDCPEGEQETVRQRCLDSLKDIEMTEEARETQTSFCMVDICNMVGNNAPGREVADYLRATHDAVEQIVAQNVYSLREGRSHRCDIEAFEKEEKQIYDWIANPELIKDSDPKDDNAAKACK